MQGIITFLLIFFAIVTVHEFGHFIVAKRSGILCQEFSIGFGPKIFHKKIGETNFTVRLLPVGGFVKMPDNVFDFNNEVSPYDLKKGMRVWLKLDENDNVEKIILDKNNDVDLFPMELDEFDLSDKLFVTGFTGNGEELETFKIRRDACVAFNGMEEQIAPLDRMFSAHSWWKKFLTLFAGPFMNFLLALFIFIGISAYTGVQVDKAVVGDVSVDSPAQMSGLQKDDIIKSVNNNSINSFTDVVTIIRSSNGSDITFKVDRSGQEKEITVTPKETTATDSSGVETKTYFIGISQPREYGILQILSTGLVQTLYYCTVIFKAIVGLFVSLFAGHFSLNQLGGPVAIYEVSNKAAQSGILQSLRLAGLLSVNIGLMNLIPIPVLDGGRIVFVLYEAIFKKPINKKAQYYVTAVFAILMVILMIAVTWNDIQRLFR